VVNLPIDTATTRKYARQGNQVWIWPEIRRADERVSELAKDETHQRLMTVPGVGPVTAVAFIAPLDDPKRFHGPKQVRAYLGLVPREHSSGEKALRGRITKQGSGRMRRLLVQAAWAVLRCSSGYLYKALYTQLELQRRKRVYPWPAVIGVDEHYFRRGRGGFRQFVSMVVDFKNRRLMELVEGRTVGEMEAQLAHIPGRDNVRFVVADLCDPYKTFAHRFFPNARVVADKFHVLRLLVPHINRRRKLVTGDRSSALIRRLLLRSRFALDHASRFAVDTWLEQHPDLRALYEAKETLHRLYRIRGAERAAELLTAFTDQLASSPLPELQTLRRTLVRWRREILAYFGTGLTNARTEGFNNKAKLVKKRAYGYRSFRNYRLRLLNACA